MHSQIRFKNRSGRIEYANLAELAVLMSIDPAFSKKREAARTAMPITATNGYDIFLLEDFAERGLGVYDIANQAISFFQRYRPQKIFLETLVGQVAVSDVLKRVAAEMGLPPLPIEEIKSHGPTEKRLRIYGLEPFFKAGRFHIRADQTNFLSEYAAFPVGSNRDILDALAFQKDEWERASRMAGHTQRTRQVLENQAIERIRRAVGRGGGY